MSLIYEVPFYGVLLTPLASFVLAAIAEVRSGGKGSAAVLRIIEIAVGAIASIALIVPLRFLARVPLRSEVLSSIMACIALLIGGSALLSKYGSRLALWLVVCASVALAFFWYFNRILT